MLKNVHHLQRAQDNKHLLVDNPLTDLQVT
jgi:hypothetical protein